MILFYVLSVSNALVDLVAIFSFIDHFGKKFIQVEYDSFLYILLLKKRRLHTVLI